jgi:acetyltransferase-like isoleucine patch superfamily enzyme
MDNCKLGDHSYIQKNSSIFNAEIGKFCSIASNVSIGPGIHKTDGISTHPVFYLSNTPLVKKYSNRDVFESSKRTVIGHDVWIGEKSIVLDGVEIGTGAIIAAGSVVTKNVDPYAIVGGVPAKLLKFRFTENEIEAILYSEWWNQSDEWLQNNYLAFNNIKSFLNILK